MKGGKYAPIFGGVGKHNFTNLMGKNTYYVLFCALFVMKMYFKRNLRIKKGKFWRNCYKMPQVSLRYCPFIRTARKNFVPFSFFLLIYQKTEENKILFGRNEILWRGIGTWWGGEFRKFWSMGGGFFPNPPLGRTLHGISPPPLV